MSGEGSGLMCFCLGHCPSGAPNGTCFARPGASCFAAVEEVLDPATGRLEPERTFGCLPPEEDGGLFLCKGHLVPHLNPASIACCSDAHFCNQKLTPMYDASPYQPDLEHHSNSTSMGSILAGLDQPSAIALLVSLFMCLILFIVLVAFLYLKYKRREDQNKYMLAARQDPDTFVKGHSGTLSDLIEQSSGSGSGLPLLVQRTIAKQIQMYHSVGKGRYGEVWLAKWRGENVAVKVFFTTEEASWFRETEIYQTVLLRHDNILGFIAADIKGSGGWTQMLLLTEYHDNGSLHDYLTQNSIDSETLLQMCHSLLSGLCHLHTEIHGIRGKPAIAHRDIKSRNILVKRDLTLAIADFGLAVRYDSDKNAIDVGMPNPRAGTSRYMAPESLDQTLNTQSMAAFLQADMYSLGLVMWEMTRRTVTGEKMSTCDSYELPYFEYVNSDPSFEEMQSVVCIKGLRPASSPRWESDSLIMAIHRLTGECWHQKSAARLSALRVKKNLSQLLVNVNDENSSSNKHLMDEIKSYS